MFEQIIVKPFLNLLFLIYTALPGHDFGIAVILLTVFIRFALYPLAKKQIRSQKALSEIQPEVNRLKEKYGKNPQEFQAKVTELYKEKEVNPFGSCLPLLIQFPFLIGLFYVFYKFQNPDFLKLTGEGILGQIYPAIQNLSFVKSFVAGNQVVNTSFLGLLDLAKPNAVLAVLAGVLQYFQTKMLTPTKTDKEDTQAAVAKQMSYIFPFLTVFIAFRLPSALPLYWSVTTLFAIGQQYLLMRHDVEVLEERSERKRT